MTAQKVDARVAPSAATDDTLNRRSTQEQIRNGSAYRKTDETSRGLIQRLEEKGHEDAYNLSLSDTRPRRYKAACRAHAINQCQHLGVYFTCFLRRFAKSDADGREARLFVIVPYAKRSSHENQTRDHIDEGRIG